MPTRTNEIFLVQKSKVPKNKKATYGLIIDSIQPNKEQLYHVSLIIGGNRMDFHGIIATQYASLMTTKMLLNGTIYTPGYYFMTLDTKDCYYGNLLSKYNYM